MLFYAVTCAFAFGILIRSFVPIGLAYIAFGVLVAFALTLMWRRDHTTISASCLFLVGMALAACMLGVLRMEVASWSETNSHFESRVGTEVSLEGVIAREPDVRESTTHLYLDIDGELILAITDPYSSYAYGDRVRIEGELGTPEAFTTDLGRTFNYPGYLRARGVSYTIIYGDLERVGSGEGNPFLSALYSGKHAFMRNVEALIPEPAAGLGEGLLLGEKRALGEELEMVFRKTGIIHIVVLSGYNIMLVVGFTLYLLSFLFGLRMRAVVGIAAIVAFAFLVGLSATVVRASVMAALLLIANVAGESYAVMRSLMFAGCVMLLLNPYLLAFDTGFQLSFLATMGLILVAPMIEERITRVPNVASVREFLVATLATQIFVLPILLYQIGEFSVVAIIVNVLVLPMVPPAMFLTFAAGMLAFLAPVIAIPFSFLAYLSLAYMLLIARWFAALPFAAFVVPVFPFWIVPFAYACMAYILWRFYIRRTAR